ncbi:MAG: class II aldolase/adducin family protein [Pseudomonadota bacterium]
MSHTNSNVTPLNTTDDWHLRVDLAAAFRLTAENDWHEAVANHFSLAVSPDGKEFLMNPRNRHFSLVRASELLLLNADDRSCMDTPNAPDASAWSIHGAIHRLHPNARCVMHVHPPYATALAGLKDPTIRPIDQVTARFYNNVAYDLEFGGIAEGEAEGERIAGALGNRRIMMMGNHGVTVVGDTVAQAFDDLYHLERACKTMVLAYSTGQPLSEMSDELAEQVREEWVGFVAGSYQDHFDQAKELLDRTDPSYAS